MITSLPRSKGKNLPIDRIEAKSEGFEGRGSAVRDQAIDLEPPSKSELLTTRLMLDHDALWGSGGA